MYIYWVIFKYVDNNQDYRKSRTRVTRTTPLPKRFTRNDQNSTTSKFFMNSLICMIIGNLQISYKRNPETFALNRYQARMTNTISICRNVIALNTFTKP